MKRRMQASKDKATVEKSSTNEKEFLFYYPILNFVESTRIKQYSDDKRYKKERREREREYRKSNKISFFFVKDRMDRKGL